MGERLISDGRLHLNLQVDKGNERMCILKGKGEDMPLPVATFY